MPSSSTGAGLHPAMSSTRRMPCATPRCASWYPGTMSPNAYTPGRVSAQPVVGEHEAAVHPHAAVAISSVRGVRAPTHGDQEQIGLELLTGLQVYCDPRAGLAGTGKLHPGLKADTPAAE